jgi:hypothetical protein
LQGQEGTPLRPEPEAVQGYAGQARDTKNYKFLFSFELFVHFCGCKRGRKYEKA